MIFATRVFLQLFCLLESIFFYYSLAFQSSVGKWTDGDATNGRLNSAHNHLETSIPPYSCTSKLKLLLNGQTFPQEKAPTDFFPFKPSLQYKLWNLCEQVNYFPLILPLKAGTPRNDPMSLTCNFTVLFTVYSYILVCLVCVRVCVIPLWYIFWYHHGVLFTPPTGSSSHIVDHPRPLLRASSAGWHKRATGGTADAHTLVLAQTLALRNILPMLEMMKHVL